MLPIFFAYAIRTTTALSVANSEMDGSTYSGNTFASRRFTSVTSSRHSVSVSMAATRTRAVGSLVRCSYEK